MKYYCFERTSQQIRDLFRCRLVLKVILTEYYTPYYVLRVPIKSRLIDRRSPTTAVFQFSSHNWTVFFKSVWGEPCCRLCVLSPSHSSIQCVCRCVVHSQQWANKPELCGVIDSQGGGGSSFDFLFLLLISLSIPIVLHYL